MAYPRGSGQVGRGVETAAADRLYTTVGRLTSGLAEVSDDTLYRPFRPRVYEDLGEDGSALVHNVLINGMTMREIAVARGKAGPAWEAYCSKRFLECLNSLAATFGYAPPRCTEVPDLVLPPIRVSTISQ
jgi:hypothetical protein